MLYIAKYALTEELSNQIVKAVIEWVHNDYYYSRNNGINGNWGMRLTPLLSGGGYRSKLNPDLEMRDVEDFTTNLQELRNYEGSIGWLTCGNNKSNIIIDGDTVVLEISGRRHGIPPVFNFFKDVEPTKVIKYSTEAPEYSWWEKGITL